MKTYDIVNENGSFIATDVMGAIPNKGDTLYINNCIYEDNGTYIVLDVYRLIDSYAEEVVTVSCREVLKPTTSAMRIIKKMEKKYSEY